MTFSLMTFLSFLFSLSLLTMIIIVIAITLFIIKMMIFLIIQAMEARSRKLNKTGDSVGAEKYQLTQPGDPSEYLSVQMFKDDAINPCLDSTYTFVDHIVKEIVNMHKDKQPLTIYHFGGDEVIIINNNLLNLYCAL